MKYVIVHQDDRAPEDVGKYLLEYDPDWLPHGEPNEYPCGRVTWTSDPRKAKKFETSLEALDEWRRQSSRTPLRPDGKPNRPLSAVTIMVASIDA